MTITYEEFVGNDPELLNGCRSSFRFALTSVSIQGQRVSLPAAGVTAFVGGNNVGKSTILREISEGFQIWQGMSASQLLISDAETDVRGSFADFSRWFFDTSSAVRESGRINLHRLSYQTNLDSLPFVYQSMSSGRLGDVGRQFCLHATTAERLGLTAPVARRDYIDSPPSHMLHVLEYDKELKQKLSAICLEAFGQSLFVDSFSTQDVLRLGVPAVEAPKADAITQEYRTAVAECRPLDRQGDGMKSMLGLLIAVMTAAYPVILIDEPEAFLHPPQARILGRELVKLAQEAGVQVLLATHSKDVLQGLLDADCGDVSVVRLTRDGDRTRPHQLESGEIRELWKNPILRYSGLLDGLFHRAVVLAENDRDCRFYENALAEAVDLDGMSVHDICFIATSGKSSMRQYVEAIRKCGVPTVATADLDVLNDENTVKQLTEVLGGSWSALKSDYKLATNEFRQKRQSRTNADVLSAIEAAISDEPDREYDKDSARKVRAHLAVDDRWKPLKDYGMSAFKAEHKAAQHLMDALDGIGLVLVRVGELESFSRAVTQDKSKFVQEALEQGAHKEPDAQEHVGRILQAIEAQESSFGD